MELAKDMSSCLSSLFKAMPQSMSMQNFYLESKQSIELEQSMYFCESS